MPSSTSRPADVKDKSVDCGQCPVAQAGRRAFLRDIGLAVVAALAVGVVGAPATALGESVTETSPLRGVGRERSYALPAADSIAIDTDNDIIIARWQNTVYAFSLKCPHKGTRLEWLSGERRVFCPKHKARFRPDGSHESGRRSRDLDRYDVNRQGPSMVVSLDALRRQDTEPEAWRDAVLVLS